MVVAFKIFILNVAFYTTDFLDVCKKKIKVAKYYLNTQ